MDPYKKPGLIKEDEEEKRRKMLGEEPKPRFSESSQEAIDSTKKALNRPTYQKIMDLFKRGGK